MLAKRIIPCLDVKAGMAVKGVHFENLQEMGDPCTLAERYAEEGADEIIFLDIAAAPEDRGPLCDLVTSVSERLSVPFTVGGGIRNVDDVVRLLEAGADKVSVNTAAFENPPMIDEIASRFGSQCLVVAIDARKDLGSSDYRVWTCGGRKASSRDALSWAKEAAERGAGEILLTSMDCDGTGNGFELTLTRLVAESLSIPVIASGGAAVPAHFVSVFLEARADAALAAGMFHRGEYSIGSVKRLLRENGIEVRL